MSIEALITSLAASLGAKGIEAMLNSQDNIFSKVAGTLSEKEKEILIAAGKNPTKKIKFISFMGGCDLDVGDKRYSDEESEDSFRSLLLEGFFNPTTDSDRCAFFYLSTLGRLIINEI